MVTVREKRKLQGEDGNWYTPFNFPYGLKHTGETKVVGYVLADKDGITFGRIHKTREEAEEIARAENARLAEAAAIVATFGKG